MAEFTKVVSAGTRIYYFDVRTDTKGHQYATITEQARDGEKRSSVYLHPEDFDKFADALTQTINYINHGKAD